MLSFFNPILSSMPVGEFKMGLLKNSDLIGQIYNTDMFCDRMKIKTLFYIPHLFKIWFKFVDCLLHWTLCNFAGPPLVEVLNGNETSYRVTNLESGKNYKITVTAEFSGGSSPPAKYQFRSFSVSTLDHEANRGKCLL